ncbi:unnamed protein product [Rodentolepis nana]|uniref:Uncharacterized protein n=1 Tax=Rodentolepis nana TaxID=102285 RepID=A0A0R3TWM3_RODNA|nr:unnamed protein product [Rodentolepis nana]
MLSTLCTKVPETISLSDSPTLSPTNVSTLSNFSFNDSTPLLLHDAEKNSNSDLGNYSLLNHLRRLMLGTSASFQFRRLQDSEMEEDARTVVTYISLGASTPLQQRHMNCQQSKAVSNTEIKNVLRTKGLAKPIRRQKSPKKRHVSWKDLEPGFTEEKDVFNRHSMYLPSLEEIQTDNEERARRRHSYTEVNDLAYPLPHIAPPSSIPLRQSLLKRQNHQHQQNQRPSITVPLMPIEGTDFDERKERYKVQLRHFKHRRRYSDWYFTLYEFDKPENPEESLALDSHLFDTILSRLHGIYALSLNSAFDPKNNSTQRNPPARLCFERLPELPIPQNNNIRRHHRRQRRCESRYICNSPPGCLSCISFGMFDSTSPHNPGQLFCPEGSLSGEIRSFYCHGCGRNMTGGSSLISVVGSAGSDQKPEFCYSMTRSVEFYKFARTIQLLKHSESRLTENRRRHRTSPGKHNPASKTPHDRAFRAPKRSRHRSSGLHHPRESISVPPLTPFPQSFLKIDNPVPSATSTRNSNREKRKKVRRVMHKRMSQQRVADWLVSTHGNQATNTTTTPASCTPPLIVF